MRSSPQRATLSHIKPLPCDRSSTRASYTVPAGALEDAPRHSISLGQLNEWHAAAPVVVGGGERERERPSKGEAFDGEAFDFVYCAKEGGKRISVVMPLLPFVLPAKSRALQTWPRHDWLPESTLPPRGFGRLRASFHGGGAASVVGPAASLVLDDERHKFSARNGCLAGRSGRTLW